MNRVLVLNYDYTPLNVTTTRRCFVLVYKGKAEIIKSDDIPIVGDYKTYVRPVIIRLLQYIKHKIRNIKPIIFHILMNCISGLKIKTFP